MSGIEGIQQHPLLDDLNAVQDAVYIFGVDEAINGGAIGGGRLRSTFTPWDRADEDYPVSKLEVVDVESGAQTAFAFAPPADVQNPMYMQETDTVTPETVNIIPVVARVLLKPVVGLAIQDTKGVRHVSQGVFLNFTPDAAVMAYDEGLGLLPHVGEFDDKHYQTIRRVINAYSPLPAILAFAASYE